MDTAFQELLKRKSDALNKKLTTPKQSNDILECRVTIADNITPNQLHVWFNRYPGPNIIADLKSAGFSWNSHIWWAIDSEPKRAFCRARLNATELDPYKTPIVTPTPNPMPQIIVAPESEPDNSVFGIYKRQVDELCEHLKLCPADLFLHAIDQLHKTTFSVN